MVTGYDFEGARRYLLTIHDSPRLLVHLYDSLVEYVADLRIPELDRMRAANIQILAKWQLEKLNREHAFFTHPVDLGGLAA